MRYLNYNVTATVNNVICYNYMTADDSLTILILRYVYYTYNEWYAYLFWYLQLHSLLFSETTIFLNMLHENGFKFIY